ncbi:MAG: lysophospholipid acyltransferase family protein [Pseudomonadota bacterium]
MSSDTAELSAVNTRDMSYALSAETRLGQQVVRLTENLTGRLPVLYRLLGYDRDVAAGEAIWDVIWRRYRLSLNLVREPLEAIPATGPAIVVCNHPYGILDGITLGKLLWSRRSDFKIIANAVFHTAPELRPFVLPIDFEGNRAAALRNIETRRETLSWLDKGGLVAVFPGGAVASSPKAFARPYDPDWKTFTAKMVTQSRAPVIPVFFVGHNSQVFEVAGRVSPALRYGLHIHEFWRRIGTTVEVAIGKPVPKAQIDVLRDDPARLMTALRRATYALSPEAADHGVDGPPLGRRWP